jgi:hypothetical protein
MPQWQRTETRVVRPFPTAESCLVGVKFKLTRDAKFDDRTSFDVSEVELDRLQPEFRLQVDLSPLGAQGSGLPAPSDLDLVIRFADARLHRSEVVFKEAVESLPETWHVPTDVSKKFSWKFGADVTVALVLRLKRSAQSGQPFMPGRWVARKDFSVRSKAEPRAFPVERWTADDFARQGLPRDTVYWIQFIADDLNRRFDDPGDAFRVCLRADVYDALDQAQDTQQGRALFSTIISEILTEVLWRGLQSLGDSEQIERGGLLHSALARVEKATNATRNSLRRLVADGELSSLRTFAQATVGMRRALAKLGNMEYTVR